jgi:hypothetical protein
VRVEEKARLGHSIRMRSKSTRVVREAYDTNKGKGSGGNKSDDVHTFFDR